MTWELIESQTLGSAASSVTFSSGLSGYKFFRLSGCVVKDASAADVLISLNGDTTNADYSRQDVTASSTSVSGARDTGASIVARRLSTGGLGVSEAGSYVALIAKPSASKKAQIVAQNGERATVTLGITGTEWSNTSDSVSSLAVLASSGSFAAGTSFLLEGLVA